MDMEQLALDLRQVVFAELEKPLIVYCGLEVSTFRYRTGVCAVRIRNLSGEIVVLPFQGQQIWSAEFADCPLGMTSIFDEPRDTSDYLATYGGLMLHCGFTAMGRPGPQDQHPVHGELPNAAYQEAYLKAGSDSQGAYLELCGVYRHSIAFTVDYIAEPTIRLYEWSTSFQLTVRFTNLRAKPLAYMYLCHINFRPVDGSRLVSTAECKQHMEITTASIFDPEVIMYLECESDKDGWAHHMQIRPDGYADYVKHRPSELDHCVRWIYRTEEEQALGLAMPATAQAAGFTLEEEKGNVKLLPAGQSVVFHVEAGLLLPSQTQSMDEWIKQIMQD